MKINIQEIKLVVFMKNRLGIEEVEATNSDKYLCNILANPGK